MDKDPSYLYIDLKRFSSPTEARVRGLGANRVLGAVGSPAHSN